MQCPKAVKLSDILYTLKLGWPAKLCATFRHVKTVFIIPGTLQRNLFLGVSDYENKKSNQDNKLI